MSLRDALDALVLLEQGVSITDPVTTSIRKAYKIIPAQSEQAPVTPFAQNVWTLREQRRFPGGWYERFYRVRIDIVTRDQDIDRAADIVTALAEQLQDDLDQHIRLNQTIKEGNLSGADPTLGEFTIGGQTMIGARLYFDFIIRGGSGFADATIT